MIEGLDGGNSLMWPDDLEILLERLQHSKGLAYRAGLARLLAAYGRDAIVRSRVESRTGNVVSMQLLRIGAAPRWGSRNPSPALQTGPGHRGMAGAFFVSRQ
jgi:hypothetical protein